MRKLAFAIAALAAITMTGLSARAAEPIGSQKLASFGLGKMTPMSDAEGSAVRGQGVSVGGFAFVKVNGTVYPGTSIPFGGGNFRGKITYAAGPGAFAGGFSVAVAR